VPRGRRAWRATLAVVIIILAAGTVTVRAVHRRAQEADILQPRDPGIVTRTIGETAH
jgi:hypothetical protein